MNLRRVDLNLLTIFDALMSERNMTRAAARLGMSQPAMSNALGRLRALTDDPLFVRTAKGMTPTPRSQSLIGPVRQALDLIQAGLQSDTGDSRFDPARSARLYVVSTEDYGETVIMPRFMDWLTRVAPGIRIRISSQPGSALARKLADGSLGLATRHIVSEDSELMSCHLLDDSFVSLVRYDHPRIGDTLSLEDYLAVPHVVFGRLGTQGIRGSIVDRALKRIGRKRRIRLEVPGFQSMPMIVRNSDFICTMPRRMAQLYAQHYRLRILPPPLELPQLPVYLVWGKATDADPEHKWLRGAFYEICQRL